MDELAHKYGTYDRQQELLKMIKDIDTLFTNNNIEYSLCGGSLLGAIRENGFIPWDDDIDIMVDRYNYRRILRLFEKKRKLLPYRIKRYLWIYRIQRKDDERVNLEAATIDIFVMDNCPDNIIIRKVKVLLVKILQGMMHEKLEFVDKSMFMRFCLVTTYAFGKLFSDRLKFRLYNTISQIGNKNRTEYITGYTDFFNLLNCRYSGKLMDKILRHKFEDVSLPITAEYDNYLTVQYGDYMTPPPVEERIVYHM